MSRADLQWTQFRRLLLGTVIEALVADAVAVRFPTLHIAFDDRSFFRVPRLNNTMRFSGALRAELEAPLDDQRRRSVEAALHTAWRELLAAIDLPIGDRLTATRSELRVLVEGDRLTVAFDLEAD